MKKTIIINGTHCPSCKALIEDVCKDSRGVKSCNFDYKSGKTEIEHDNNFDFESLKKEIEGLGDYKIESKK